MTEQGEFTHDVLVAGDKGLKTEDIFVKSGTAAFVRGTVLGRVKQATDTTGSITGTGNGTCTSVTGGPDTKRGTYTITCVVAITHGGTFDVADPDGEYIGSVTITAGAGGTGVFKSRHLNFTLTDGSTDFALADVFDVAVTDGVPATGSITGTGDGTLTLVEGRRDVKLGAYIVICTAAVTHGGVFKVTDPDGNDIQTDITIPPGAGNSIAFENEEMVGTITDGSTDFIVGDYFTVTVTIQPRQVLKLDKTATDGSSAPYAVASEDIDAAAAAKTGVGYLEGEFNQRALVFASGTDVEDVRDEMRDLGMLVKPSVNN